MSARRDLADVLRDLGACASAVAWATAYGAAWTTALAACPRHDWLAWLYGRLLSRGLVPREPLVLAACEIARTTLHRVSEGEVRPLRAIETAEAWCRGEASLDDVRRAGRGAWDAYAAAYVADAAAAAATAATATATAAYAADAAAYAADAAAAAATATATAAYAATATATAAYATATYAYARGASLAQSREILRRHLGAHLLRALAEVQS